ncbi:MAG: rod shape-determining protein MreD [Candidatus Acidiferrales bacterium]
MALRDQIEQHIEVHKYSLLAVWGTVFLALLLQASLPIYFPRAALLDLPLLITLYFGLSRRNPSTGLLLGMAVGLLQDGISRTPIGLYGIAKTVVGFGASSIGARLDVEHPLARALLMFVFFHVHQIVFAATRRLLLQESEQFFSVELLIASLVNAALSVLLFPLLDKLRR